MRVGWMCVVPAFFDAKLARHRVQVLDRVRSAHEMPQRVAVKFQLGHGSTWLGIE